MGGRSGKLENESKDSAKDGRREGGWYELNVYRYGWRVSLSSLDLRSFSIRKGGGVIGSIMEQTKKGRIFMRQRARSTYPKILSGCTSNQFIQRKESLFGSERAARDFRILTLL